MKVFISWSGNRSKAIATVLRRWIPDVIQLVEPWMSEADIDAGTRWGREMEKELEGTKFGIICLTKNNLNAPWILFEAGALAKTVADTFVCPYLIDLSPSDIPQGPLTQFQAKRSNKKETWEIVCSINKALKDRALNEEKLRRTFERWWPDLRDALEKLPAESNPEKLPRSIENVTEEVLDLVRGLARTNSLYTSMFEISEDVTYIKSVIGLLLTDSRLERGKSEEVRLDIPFRRSMGDTTILVEIPTSNATTKLIPFQISPEESLFVALSGIWELLQDTQWSCNPKAYTYLWDWILIGSKTISRFS